MTSSTVDSVEADGSAAAIPCAALSFPGNENAANVTALITVTITAAAAAVIHRRRGSRLALTGWKGWSGSRDMMSAVRLSKYPSGTLNGSCMLFLLMVRFVFSVIIVVMPMKPDIRRSLF